MALTHVSYSTGGSTGFGLSPQRKLQTLSGIPSSGSTGAAGGSSSLAAALAPNKAYGLLNPGTTIKPSAPKATISPNTGYGMLNPGTTLPGTTTPKPPAASQQSQASSSAGTAAPNLDSDPILQQIRQLAGANDAQAKAAALSGKEQLLENLGDADLAGTLGLGSNVAGVAAQNPNSIFAQLAHTHSQNAGTIDQNAALNNTFFGSVRANNLADELNRYQQAKYDADQQARQQIGQIDQTLAQALQADRDRVLQGLADAYNRYLASQPSTPSAPSAPPPPSAPPAPASAPAYTSAVPTAPNPRSALSLASALRRAVAV